MPTDLKTIAQEIKSRLSCVEYAQQNNLPIRKSGDRCVSPLRAGASNNSSFWVFDEHWYDWGDGTGGDVIDFAAMLHYNGDKGKAIRELAKATGVQIDNFNSSAWMSFTQTLNGEIQHYHEQLTEEDREYLYKRGITDDTINRIKIGRTDNGRLCFPYWKNGYICYYVTRSMPGGAFPKTKYKKMEIAKNPMCEHTVWGLHSIENNPERDLLVIAEGAFDALSFEQEKFSVISAITGHFSREQLPTVLSTAKMFNRVFLVYDNDTITKAGEKFTVKMTKILIENRIPCLVGKVPNLYKDVSEFYADGGNLQELITNAKDGIQFIAEQITDIKEFEPFVKNACRYMTVTEINSFFKELVKSVQFDADVLKELQKECKKAPPDDVIANEIIAKHKLLYNPKISFFEFNGKYWERKSNESIERYISLALGPYATGPKLSSISRIIKAKTVTDELFNMKPILNLINGAIEITEEEPYFIFREHRENDYCTYCLGYPYDPHAVCHDWQNFISSVTDYDDKRQAFLQEFAGYILYPDNRIHKCAALVGEGANGKSIYFNALSNLFGKENVSRITISNLSQDFQAINLLGSMLNISSETKTEFNGAEETFKQVVSGDDISACYKGKDYITFKPRAKMIISLNNMPKSNDKSNGLTRRFAFVKFHLTFVENPQEPNERLLDRTLEAKFAEKSHLSGILNWALDGYVMVRRCGYLTETNEHIEQLDVFMEDSDPTIVFVKQLSIINRISNSQLYDEYKYWCADNNYKPESSRAALRLISKHFKQYRKDIEPYVSNGKRGYQPKIST
jgi:putative DNA primase/helicase